MNASNPARTRRIAVGVLIVVVISTLAGLILVDRRSGNGGLGASDAFTSQLGSKCEPSEPPPLLEELIPLTTHTVAEIRDAVAITVARSADDDATAFVGTRDGVVVEVTAAGAVTPFVDLSDDTSTGSDRGLLGLAAHPDEAVVLVMRTDGHGDTVLTSHPTASPETSEVLMRVEQPDPRHNGGGLAFTTTGDLLIGIGDGGGQGDPAGEASDPTSILGSILRVRVDLDDAELRPARPSIPGVHDLVWAFGVRNPFRIWLADDGDVFVADVGEMCVEEVTRLDGETVGQDLGWNHLEGDRVFDTDSRHGERTPVPPVITWTHATGSCAVVGGTEYLGDIAELRGAQIVGDLCTGDLYAVFDDRIGQIPVRLDSPVDVTIGPDGELWVIDMAVGVRRITRRPVAP